MSGILGTLCHNKKDLKRSAYKRRSKYIKKSVKHTEVKMYEMQGWKVVRENINTARIRKSKPPDVLFEDQVWMIFYNLGFWDMNKSRKCKLKFNSYTKQIDVLARDHDNIFIVDCMSSQEEGIINAKDKLEELVGKQEDIKKAIQSEWGRSCGRINIVVVISSMDKREQDEEYVKSKRKKDILLWSNRDIRYIENLIQQIGSSAKYQLYSVIFAGRKKRDLKKDYLTLRSKIGNRVFYSFLISAKELLKYAYVHHRKLTSIVEVSKAYQRMLRSSRLKQISKFIDVEEGYFPNSIIVNFSEPLTWNKKEAMDDVAVGLVTLPGYYGCAWIIDGQHRLYGAASANKDIVIPVLAFEGMEQIEQANLFVDINEKQKKVEKNLLWDLYSDIYLDSLDEKQKKQYQIAETAKKMEASGPLKDYIDIPSIPKDRPIKLSLTTVCSTIEKYSPWDNLKRPTDETKTPENAARVLNSYFRVLKALWPEDWAKGNEGVLLTNNGFGVFMMVFQDIINHLVYKQKEGLLKANKSNEFEELLSKIFLNPVIEHLKNNEKARTSIRRASSRGSQSDCAVLLDIEIRDSVKDYSPPRMYEYELLNFPLPEEPPKISKIEEKAQSAEPILRDFILKELKNNYVGDKWWKQGIPGGLKIKADEMWIGEVIRKPHLRHEGNQNERKFGYFGLGELTDIVVYGKNWEQVFKPVFFNNVNFKRRINDINVLRRPTAHKRRYDDQDVADGRSGLLWLSKCLGNPDLHP